jgi:hypothetical protein
MGSGHPKKREFEDHEEDIIDELIDE